MTVLRSGSATDVGRVRPINQDMPLERPNLYAVADGMGGHVGGEVAARVAVETLDHAFERAPTVSGLRAAFSEANAAVWHESQVNADLHGMGTTLTAVALVGGDDGRDVLALANVGDSRAYVYSDGRLVQVTADHSLAEERMRHGEMTEAEAAVHPQRHILTRALGVSSDVQTDMWELELKTGDRVLLCSDGLSNEVGMDEMADILGQVRRSRKRRRDHLVDAANDHGGADNITVVIVDVQVGEDGCRHRLEVHADRGQHRRHHGGLGRRGRGGLGRPGQRQPARLGTGASRRRGMRHRRRSPPSSRPTPPGRCRCTAPAESRPTPTRTRWPPGRSWGSAVTRRRWGRSRAATSSSSAPARRCPCRAPRPGSRSHAAARHVAQAQGEGDPARASASPRHPPAPDLPGARLHHAGGGRARRRLLRDPLVRLRQLDRDPPWQPGRDRAGPAGRRAVVPPQGGRSAPRHEERPLPHGGARAARRGAEVFPRRGPAPTSPA